MTEPLRILVVDDDEPYITDVLSSAPVFEGFATEEAATGVEALATTRRGHFDCIVLDEMLSDGDGFAVCRTLELDTPGPVPVLGDAVRLERLVHDLVDNALAHTPTGTPVGVRVATDGDRAVPVEPSRTPDARREDAAGVSDGAVTPLLPGTGAGHR